MRNHTNHGYDQLADRYHLLEKMMFGSSLAKARTALLSSIPPCHSALLFGDGDGRFLEAFLSMQPECQITSVDQSQRMLDIQQQRLLDHPLRDNVTWLQQDIRDFAANRQQFDLLVTAFFLDCFSAEDLRTHLPVWLSALKPDGHFYFVDFQKPDKGWKRLRGRVYLKIMHLFFRWYTDLPNEELVDINSVLPACPMELLESKDMSHDLICARLYRMASA